MFHALSGILSGYEDTRIYLQSDNVEWEIEVSERCKQFCLDSSASIRLFIHLLVREDLLRLYGFERVEERAMFLQLISVNMVGPKLALRILSRFSSAEIWRAIHHEDIASLSLVSGLGKKNAEKIILALKDKAQQHHFEQQGSIPDEYGTSRSEELLNALLLMGYDRQKSRSALKHHLNIDDDAEVLRLCIAEMSTDVGG